MFQFCDYFVLIVHLSLLTMTNLNQMREALLFMCSKMADESDYCEVEDI